MKYDPWQRHAIEQFVACLLRPDKSIVGPDALSSGNLDLIGQFVLDCKRRFADLQVAALAGKRSEPEDEILKSAADD